MYRMYVNGREEALYSIRVSKHPINRTWPGYQRDISQSETAYMAILFGSCEREIRIEAESTPTKAVIRPLSKGVKAKICGNTVSFTLPAYGKFSVEIDDRHNNIHIFCQKNDFADTSRKATFSFEKGEHHTGLVKLHSNESVYIARGAVVHGSFYACDAENIEIYGGGVLCSDWEDRKEKHGDIGWDNENSFSPELVHTYGGIRTYRCNNISVRGITVTDTASYAVSFFAGRNFRIDDVNVTGLWKYNCDGIDFINCGDIYVKDTFIRSFDDSMCMKGFTAFSDKNTENAIVENSVFWCDWGKNLDIGLATAAKEMHSITWRNCDIIHNSGSCLTISNGMWADIHDIVYDDIRIEYANDTEPSQVQTEENQKYIHSENVAIPSLITIQDTRRNWQGNISYDDERTKIRNILFNNIRVYLDEELAEKPKIRIFKKTTPSVFDNIRIENLYINGKKTDPKEITIS